MSDDAELELFRASVNCAAVLESMSKGWKLDSPPEHPARPEIPPGRGRDPDHQP